MSASGCATRAHCVRYGHSFRYPLPIVELIPGDVRRFVLMSVPTLPHLEALLLLHRFPAQGWGAADLARRLYIGADVADALLQDLSAQGLAEKESTGPKAGDRSTFRFPAIAALDALVTRVEATYGTQLVELSRLIHSRTDRKAQQFADAFAFKKDHPR